MSEYTEGRIILDFTIDGDGPNDASIERLAESHFEAVARNVLDHEDDLSEYATIEGWRDDMPLENDSDRVKDLKEQLAISRKLRKQQDVDILLLHGKLAALREAEDKAHE